MFQEIMNAEFRILNVELPGNAELQLGMVSGPIPISIPIAISI